MPSPRQLAQRKRQACKSLPRADQFDSNSACMYALYDLQAKFFNVYFVRQRPLRL